MSTAEQKLRKGWKQEIEFRHSEREQAQRDLAALRAENQRLRQIIADMLAYAQDKAESELLDSDGRIVIRIPLATYRAALAATKEQTK